MSAWPIGSHTGADDRAKQSSYEGGKAVANSIEGSCVFGSRNEIFRASSCVALWGKLHAFCDLTTLFDQTIPQYHEVRFVIS